jgi:hypothetical protein
LKAKNVISSNNYDVAKPMWLKRVTKLENLTKIQEFYPWELYSACLNTKRRLEANYDQYYDSYVEDTNNENLTNVMKKMDEMVIV